MGEARGTKRERTGMKRMWGSRCANSTRDVRVGQWIKKKWNFTYRVTPLTPTTPSATMSTDDVNFHELHRFKIPRPTFTHWNMKQCETINYACTYVCMGIAGFLHKREFFFQPFHKIFLNWRFVKSLSFFVKKKCVYEKFSTHTRTHTQGENILIDISYMRRNHYAKFIFIEIRQKQRKIIPLDLMYLNINYSKFF